MLRFINFISGGGSTNLAVLEAEKPGGRLHGLTETAAIVSSNPEAPGIERAINNGFPKQNIEIVNHRDHNFTAQLLSILDKYKPDYFHQLGWMPHTPTEVLNLYNGLNQHLGPGGKWMYGERRIYAFTLFCGEIGAWRPIPVFCQRVAPDYDKGNVICLRYEKISAGEAPDEIAKRLLPVEHWVQIEGRRCLANKSCRERPVPLVALNKEEEQILEWAKKQANEKYSLQ